MENYLKERLDKVLQNEAVDLLFIMNTNQSDPNFVYLTDFQSGLFESSFLIGDKEGLTLFTSELEYETALEQSKGAIKVVNLSKEPDDVFKRVLKDRIVGINGKFLPFAYYKWLRKTHPKKIVDVSKSFADARMIKTEEEIDRMRKAVSIIKWSMLEVQKYFKEGMTELELAGMFDYISSKFGSAKPSFETIVAFGKNSALPHHTPDGTKLQKGDIVLIDAGATYKNYCSDLTRSFIFVEEDANEKIKEMMKVVKDAQIKAMRAAKSGASPKRIHNIAQNHIDSFKDGIYRGTFIHNLGHSIGIEVHDGPGFGPSAKGKLEPGMVLSVEPGIYVVGFGGIRIEDDILITKEGAAEIL